MELLRSRYPRPARPPYRTVWTHARTGNHCVSQDRIDTAFLVQRGRGKDIVASKEVSGWVDSNFLLQLPLFLHSHHESTVSHVFDDYLRHAPRCAGDFPGHSSPQASHDVFGDVGEGHSSHLQEIHVERTSSNFLQRTQSLTLGTASGNFRGRRNEAYSAWTATTLRKSRGGAKEQKAERASRFFGVQPSEFVSSYDGGILH